MEDGSIFCVNCGSASACMFLHEEHILQCIRQMQPSKSVQAHELVCTTCWNIANEIINTTNNDTFVGSTCAICRRALPPRTRSHQIIALRTDTYHQQNIKSIIYEKLVPMQVHASHRICHPCWQKADRVAKHYIRPSTSSNSSQQNPLRCINCHVNLLRLRRHILDDISILSLLQQRLGLQLVHETDYVCDSCHVSLIRDASSISQDEHHISSNREVCLGCGYTSRNRHMEQIQDYEHILHIVRGWIEPIIIQPTDLICRTCIRRAESALPDIGSNTQEQSLPVQMEASGILPAAESSGILPVDIPGLVPQRNTITLPNISRAPSTHSRCIFPRCSNTHLIQIPLYKRAKIFNEYKYYIPSGNRLCSQHFSTEDMTELLQAGLNSFTADQIEDFHNLLKNKLRLDFENVEEMDDNLVWYWLGRTKEQFQNIVSELPRFDNKATSLAAYLIKLRTGDSDARIASLFEISRSKLMKLISSARNAMESHFVPRHLGINHMSRTNVAERNLYIPESLFGNPGSNIAERKAIVIMDGTYNYIQKSSNYSFQKKTYSLHKYRNLVKPFLIVCCDGYILDVLGPYPATKSDSDILKDQFDEQDKPLRQFFNEGDVFILDRGFRDSIPLMQSLNYAIHYPLSLEPGETQMSTVNANESRKVTLCRWVVEIVNGRFKRDYKLLRQNYFNKTSKNLMTDFKVAAALINRFHLVLTDREDARDIVSVIQEHIFTNNVLADYVESNNLNRRRAQFESMTVNINNITDFPQMEHGDLILISLGTYQIKQARSYYGEHVRPDGNYVIEVCREVDTELLNSMNLNDASIVRGRIKSRFISSKMYFVYIIFDNSENSRNAIKQYCCNCIVGRRTIGCCAHIMTIIWYLSWARYQNNINPPAQFLDNILEGDDH